MKISQTKQSSSIIKYFLIFLILSLPLFLFLVTLQPGPRRAAGGTKTPTKPGFESSDLRIRPGYQSYEAYVQRQLNKTLNPKLRQIWTTRDWERKIKVFSRFFSELKNQSLLFDNSKALCIGARVGQEVEALRRTGVADSVGIDLVPCPPLVVKGDFHHQPFDDATFDFEFSNVFDHALYPEKFVSEIERTLRLGGVCVLHVALSRRADKYSANDLYSFEPLVRMFEKSDLVHVRKIDGFGLDTEVVFRKRQ
ncbi:hypothetical protein L484_027629 [Morus notabilis]|uniref:Methyltransferase type 11 domain-containing protein n=2 Tax=Morus notabilis TaxID=981085 RepID=W9RKH6_9ROSA|nr:hypothetical protein L484_027629 [Morus notabilis]